MNLNQEFELLPSKSQLRLAQLYNGHYTGSHCWRFSGRMFQMMMNSYNVNLRIIFNLPDSTHCWIMEQVSGCSHARKLINQRFIKFVNSLFNTKRSIVKSLFMAVHSDVRSHIGENMRRVLTDTRTQIVPGRTKQSDLQNYTVYQVPEEELWRLSILESLMEIRSDNWSVIFNEEEEEEDDLEENDIEAMIYEACTT